MAEVGARRSPVTRAVDVVDEGAVSLRLRTLGTGSWLRKSDKATQGRAVSLPVVLELVLRGYSLHDVSCALRCAGSRRVFLRTCVG